MGRSRKRRKRGGCRKEEVAEDWCFACKDGGHLRVCDHGNCLKAYHPECVGKDSDFLHSDEQFICNWHTCFICKRTSYYRCFCCPNNSVCRGCVREAEFVQVMKGTKGFCNNCLRLAILIEKNVDVDSDGERVDFCDAETYEFLFKEYWEIVKDTEGLTLGDLQEAGALLQKGLNCKQGSDSEKIPDEENSSDEDFLGNNGDDDDDDYADDDESSFLSDLKGKSSKVKTSLKESKSKKAYVGWGSKDLIAFLSLIGKDTSESLDQFGAAAVVKEYIQQKGLLQQDKKKYVLCDDKLWSLFRKTKLKYKKIYSLLETHIAANATSEDESLASSEDDGDSNMKKKARTVSFEPNFPKRTPEVNKRCLASLVGDNIKLIYLKRSLILDLLKHPDTFEHKVIGCFIRVKNDPKVHNYHIPQKLYQLGQVTGIKKSPEEYKIRDTSTDILLCVSNICAEVKISMLSDDNFEEEECEDLRLLVKQDPFKRPTVAELEEKVKIVHGDIVSHWINKELVRLERLIEMANEKGWRNEMHEYIDKRQVLRAPSERQRLLEEIPQVIPDMEEMKVTEFAVAADNSSQKNTGQVAPACSGAAEEEAFKGPNRESSACLKSCTEEKCKGTNRERAVCLKSCTEEKSEGLQEHGVDPSSAIEDAPHVATVQLSTFLKVNEEAPRGTSKQGIVACEVVASEATKANPGGHTLGLCDQKQNTEAGGTTEAQLIVIDEDEDGPSCDKGGEILVVDVDADEDWDIQMVQRETKPASHGGQEAMMISKHSSIWHYLDPQGDEQGPFTMELLHCWKEDGYFDEDFKVWRTGQTMESAILLRDALQMTS